VIENRLSESRESARAVFTYRKKGNRELAFFFFNGTVASRPTVISTVRFSTVVRDFDPYVNFTVDFTVEFEFG
jgi:hypothetical protein